MSELAFGPELNIGSVGPTEICGVQSTMTATVTAVRTVSQVGPPTQTPAHPS